MNDTVSLALSGKVSLADFARAVSALEKLLHAIQADRAPDAKPYWLVDELRAGSAFMSYRGFGDGIETIVDAYTEVGREAAQGRALPQFREAVTEITSVIGRNGTTSVRFETIEDDSEIVAPINQAVAGLEVLPATSLRVVAGGRGSVRGRIQSITNRKSLHFTLYDLHSDKAVSCYLMPGNESSMRKAWGRIAVVSGMVRRNPKTGDPTTVRGIRAEDIALIPEIRGSWRDAIGATKKGKNKEPSENLIRRARDA